MTLPCLTLKLLAPLLFFPTGAGQDVGVWEVVQLMIAARLASIVPLLVNVAEIHAVVSAQSTQSPSANHGCVESMFLYVLNVCCG